MTKTKAQRYFGLPRLPWSGTSLLEASRALNARCMALLVEAAGQYVLDVKSPAIEELQTVGSRMDSRAYERAVRCPVLLVYLHWQRAGWWQSIRSCTPIAMHLNSPPPLCTQEAAAPLLHEILMSAWNFGKSHRSAAQLVLGMAPEVTQAIAQLTVHDISQIAQDHSAYIRPRWEKRGAFWSRLLTASVGEVDEPLTDVQLHALSLLGGEIASSRGTF